jgi:hypothetical protein
MLMSWETLAANNATGTFRANIKVGTCNVSMTSGLSVIDLGSFDSGTLTAASVSSPLLTSDNAPQTLTVNCAGLPLAVSKPTLTLTGDSSGTADTSVFRTAGLGDDTTPSLGMRVQAQITGGKADWSTIPYMNNNGTLVTTGTGANANGNIIPVRFSMWCKPVTGQTYQNCKETGKVAAGLTFSFDYK